MLRYLFLLLFCFPFQLFAQYTYVPDDNFEQELINLGLDQYLDNTVLTVSIDTVTTLYIQSSGISDLTGIESFVALQSLFCYDNNLNTLNLANNTQLFEVTCSDNNLTSIDLRNGNNSGLWYFMSTNNPSLTCIDVDDVAYCEYTFSVDSWTQFSNNCNLSSTLYYKSNKQLIKILDVFGRTVDPTFNRPLFYMYNNGTVEKRIVVK